MENAPIDRVLAKLPNVKRCGSGWKARCPAHKDTQPSLTIGIGLDGQVLLHCHAGCDLTTILTALGLSLRDLFPNDAFANARPGAGASHTTPPRRRISAVYDYVAPDGTLLYQTVRLDPKGFYQRRPDGKGGWIHDLQGVERVLYRLPALLAAPTRAVWLVEGEKDADALTALGLLATTAVGGASAAWLAQYTAWLADHPVILLPDNDAPGLARVWTIAQALWGVVPRIRILELPGLPAKGDVSDWLADGHTKAELIALAKATPPLTDDDLARRTGKSSYHHSSFSASPESEDGQAGPEPPVEDASAPLPPVPVFPVEVFPLGVRRYVVECAAALGVPVDMVAVPLLGFVAGVIGNTHVLRLKAGWIQRAILWLAVVGDPGSGKSPALGHAQHPIDRLQKQAWDRFQEALVTWEQAVLDAKRDKQLPPEKPQLEHFLTTDTTTEALAVILGASPGLVLVRDELVGWVKSHDAYRKAGDRQQWLSLWAGAPLKVDRRTAGPIYVPKPTVSVVGGIQPDLLRELAAEANRRDGFVDRLLGSWPDAQPQRWTEASVSAAATQDVQALFAALRPTFRVEEAAQHDLAPTAKATFSDWYNENAARMEQTQGLAAGCYAKYPGQCARIALVLHVLRCPDELSAAVDEGTVLDAIAVVEYFRGHLARLLPAFGAEVPTTATTSEPLARRVSRILREVDGAWIARTELHRRLGGSTDSAALTTVLTALEQDELVEMRSMPTGGKPREEWRWVTVSASEGTPQDPPQEESAAEDAAHTGFRRYEDMKKAPDAPLSSYLHIFGDDAHTPEDAPQWQETYL